MEIIKTIAILLTLIGGSTVFFVCFGPLVVFTIESIKKSIHEFRLRKVRKEDFEYHQKYTDLYFEHRDLKDKYDLLSQSYHRLEADLKVAKAERESERQAFLIEIQHKDEKLQEYQNTIAQLPKPRIDDGPPFFWNSDMRFFYRQVRLKHAIEENIISRFTSEVTREYYPTFNAYVTVRPGEEEIKKAKKKGNLPPSDYETSLSDCTCDDFKHNLKKKSACKHMFALALHLNLITEQGEFNDTTPLS